MIKKSIKIFMNAAGILFLGLVFASDLYAADVNEPISGSGSLNDIRVFFAFAAIVAVGISCITSAYALSKIGSAALGAMSEKPEIGGRALVFLGMAEGIAIYGLIVAIMILNKI